MTRSKDEIFNALLTDAVTATYNVPGLAPDQAASVEELRARMDAAGMLDDCDD